MWHKPTAMRHFLVSAIGVMLVLSLLRSYLHLTPVRVSQSSAPSIILKMTWAARLTGQIPVVGTTSNPIKKYLDIFNPSSLSGVGFERLAVSGFQNDGIAIPGGDGHGNPDGDGDGDVNCERRRHTAMLGVQPSFDLQDDLTKVVLSLSAYPQIERAINDRNGSFEAFVGESWAELAGSGVWLPDHQVYLVVSRLIYYPSGSLAVPTISFLRGRVFDAQWKHLENYSLKWDGELISFPCTFDIPITWPDGGVFIGPEDPRVVLEDGVQGAEPVIVFNMLSEQLGGRRAMWLHRPFSNFTTALKIRGEDQKHEEKNWAPFFQRYPRSTPLHQPSHHLNFVYSLHPLRILRCQLLRGHCDWVFEQEPARLAIHTHPDVRGDMRGGTNFVPVHQSDPDIHLWVGFPRTHLDGACGSNNATYRPELVVLANSGAQFHIVYASDAMDFGTAVLDRAAREEPCDAGRILIPNGIVRWDQGPHDLMHLALSVADRTTQVVRLRGVSQLVESLPYLEKWRRALGPDDEPWGQRWSNAGGEVVGCSVAAAGNSSMRHADADVRDGQLTVVS
ncbi:glycosyltransferase family 91 protein [Penicillium hispanicum]|uniref:glycosyltransferase family 91 protein n=1 Tax=Penicillium hispanicum TaxID=1080232 RepID=UPI0025416AF6|nr:glycosyltransferase family 91 protein [Penicillium hispanicum]KAJ5595365.1 glycosyltransferase family 91 protein [Penicillium hispanicum]